MIEVSGELFFFQNFIMNFIILHLTGYFSKKEESMLRLFVGAAIGAIYSFIFFFPNLHYLFSMSFKILVSMLIVLVSFRPNRFKEFIKYVLVFYLISFVFGGATFALFYFTDFKSILSNGIFYLESFSVQRVYYATAIAYLLIAVTVYLMRTKIKKENLHKEIVVRADGNSSTINAMIDTGNSLTEPLTHTPVIVVEASALSSLLPHQLLEMVTKDEVMDLSILLEGSISPYWASRIKIIPFSSLGQKNGMLLGFRPDSVYIKHAEESRELKKVIIGVTDNELSANGDYRALLNPNILI